MTLSTAQARSAADVLEAVLPYPTQTAGPPAPAVDDLGGPAWQVLGETVVVYPRRADGQLRYTQRLLPSVLHDRSGIDAFPDQVAARNWYASHRNVLPAVVQAALALGADELCWKLAYTLEAVLAPSDDLTTWVRIAEAGLGDTHAQAWMRPTSGGCATVRGRDTEAIGHYRVAIEYFRQVGELRGMLLAINRLGVAHLAMRDLEGATQAFTRVQPLAGDDSMLHALAEGNLAAAALERGVPPAVDPARPAVPCRSPDRRIRRSAAGQSPQRTGLCLHPVRGPEFRGQAPPGFDGMRTAATSALVGPPAPAAGRRRAAPAQHRPDAAAFQKAMRLRRAETEPGHQHQQWSQHFAVQNPAWANRPRPHRRKAPR